MNFSIEHRDIFCEIFNRVDLTTLGRLTRVSKEVRQMISKRLMEEKLNLISKFRIREKAIQIVSHEADVSYDVAVSALIKKRGDILLAAYYC